MSQGVIYYNKGTKCLIRLLVSIYSLRKHYDGNICVIQEGLLDSRYELFLTEKLNVAFNHIPDSGDYPLVVKSRINQYTPFDVSLFIDADTLITGKIDDIWEKIKEHGFIVTQFVDWRTDKRTIRKRIEAWKGLCDNKYIEDAVNYGGAVNTGVFGFLRNAGIFNTWEFLTKKGESITRIPDEIACQILLPHHKHLMVEHEWNRSLKYDPIGKPFNVEETKIIHYHGRKHVQDRVTCHLWKVAYWEMVHKYGLLDIFTDSQGDRHFRSYLKDILWYRKNLTFVTAVNSKYWEGFKKNFTKWMQTEGLMEYNFIIFIKDIYPDDMQMFFSGNNYHLVDWRLFPHGDEREKMLSSFVFGAAEHVKTPYWIKIDGDVKPKGYRFTINPEWFKCCLVGHRWHYTKVKGAYTGKHWLNMLDEWWQGLTGKEPVFPKDISGIYHKHERLASFVQFHRSDFVRKVAKLCGERLPVPSQDTTVDYIARRTGEKILGVNFKKEMEP